MARRDYTLQHAWTSPPIIGFLGATTAEVWSSFTDAFDERLRECGWIDGANVLIEYQWAQGREDRYSKLAKYFADDVGVELIVTSGTPATQAAKKATKNIPIVFASAGHPVQAKLVASMQRPGGNVTGMANGQADLAARRLDELHRVLPQMKHLAVIGNYINNVLPMETQKVQKRARKLKIDTTVCDIDTASQIGPTIKRLRGEVDAIYVCTDPLMTTHHVAINTAAAAAGLPTMHAFREYVVAGGLMSYGPNFRSMFSSAADLVDQILRGAKPANLPVKMQKGSELVVNQTTAHALGIKIPKSVRRRAEIV
jgi:putative ABC transport system substrate-binding protein